MKTTTLLERTLKLQLDAAGVTIERLIRELKTERDKTIRLQNELMQLRQRFAIHKDTPH